MGTHFYVYDIYVNVFNDTYDTFHNNPINCGEK